MKVTYHNSAAVVIQENSTKILIDPWFFDGEYFGSWGIYPPYDFKSEEFEDVDYIYISHVHPDHCSPKTLSKLNKNIPILIHNFSEKFLKKNIENLGFKVIELENNERTLLKENLYINIIAADNCNPEICGKSLGCGELESEFRATQIDSMAVIDNGKQVIVNTNDCPFEIAENTAKIIKNDYKNIDLLLVGYTGASSYPQCFNFEKKDMNVEKIKKTEKRLGNALSYVEIFNPRCFMPFAGRYTLAGKNYLMNEDRGEPDLDFALEYLSKRVDETKNKCLGLNSKENFDLDTNKISKPYEKIDLKKKDHYIKNVLSKIKYDFEEKLDIDNESIIKLLPESYSRFNSTRQKIGYSTETKIILEISDKNVVVVSVNGEGYEIISPEESKKIEKYIKIKTDIRLLYWLLEGPRKAHWNNADIGSHIQFKRIPNIYERGLMYCWNFFYSGKYN